MIVSHSRLVGSGSQFLNSLVTGSTPTRTNYGQYRNLVLGNEDASFVFGGVTSSYWYANLFFLWCHIIIL